MVRSGSRFNPHSLVFFLPLIVLTAIAIKLDGPRPVFFRQSRKGFNGTIGRLLRSASIDELPQILNVLRGEMSLIRPRPHALAHDNYFESILSDCAFRHHVKPGITGWAQCNGARGETPSIEHIAERVKL
jgi:lipopolysaccharide/colanic/teichoic acid biosynthesis glycosyltransferase